MKTTVIGFILFTLVVCCSSTKESKTETEGDSQFNEGFETDLPALDLSLRDGSSVSAKTLSGKVALIFFFPDCDHCQREAAQIQKNIAGFKDYTLYFISSAPFPEIDHFATTYQLSNYKNVVFARAESQQVVEVLGPIETPTILLYDKNGILIETFTGEVAVEVILKYI